MSDTSLVHRLANLLVLFLSLALVKLQILTVRQSSALKSYFRRHKVFKTEHNKPVTCNEDEWTAPVAQRRIVQRDGVNIVMKVASEVPRAASLAHLGVSAGNASPKRKIMLFACPLGQCGFSIYYPLMALFGPEFTYLTWDYRGMFDSDKPGMKRHVTIHEHAKDGAFVLKTFLQLDDQDQLPDDVEVTLVGHSMGVQVALEIALLFPNLISSLVLLNGAHGQVFSTAFQPIIPMFGIYVPFLSMYARALTAFVARRPWLVRIVYKYGVCNPVSRLVVDGWGKSYFGSPSMRRIIGNQYLSEFMNSYLGTISKCEDTSYSYARYFQELDMHSVRHCLADIHQPSLLISGLWDFYTPCSHMFEMADAMPNAIHHCDFWSTHATLLEHPEYAMQRVSDFLQNLDGDNEEPQTNPQQLEVSPQPNKQPSLVKECKNHSVKSPVVRKNKIYAKEHDIPVSPEKLVLPEAKTCE